ncbi:MAG: DUF3999 family protein [Opitutae bacterium]|nr:DUF3999 family protein [Opitutae bacterium]
MKNPMHPDPKLRALLLPLLAAATLQAALTPTEWSHRQALPVVAPGLVRVALPAATFDSAGPDLADLRIVDSTGREVAYLLDRPPVPVARTARPASFAMALAPDATILTLATGTKEALSTLVLETPGQNFLCSARVELSDDGQTWMPLDQGLPLFRQWGAEKLDLSLGEHRAAFVRVIVTERRGPFVPFTGARLQLSAGQPPAAVPVGTRLASRDEFAGETVLGLALDGRHVPLASLDFVTDEPLFMRRVTVTVREFQGGVSTERTVGTGTIYRVSLAGAPARGQSELRLDFTPLTRELLVHIHNGDSPPLALGAVQAKRRATDVLFLAPTAGSYHLLTGNPQAGYPRYDLAAFSGEMRDAHAAPVTPGELEAMPGYRPRETLAESPLPEVPLTGAPLDTKDWTRRRAIRLAHAGVQELELDPAVLAEARTDFADLRVLRGDNQIPYVLEHPALSRAAALMLRPAPDPKRPRVSVWQLPLPSSQLPLQRLVLTSDTPLFERRLRIFEKVTGSDGRLYDNTLAAGEWSRTPEAGTPDARTFELTARPRTGTLFIETDNGDNPAITLTGAKIVFPVVRVIFKTAETDGFTLAYGQPAAAAPRYDLGLVAAKLLTAPRHPATLSATVAAAPDRNPFAGLNGGYLFWGALAVVIVVLLVTVAKLLPKPPTGRK